MGLSAKICFPSAEMAQLEKDILNKSKEADKEKSGNFLLAAAGCFSVIPWFYMDMEAVESSTAVVEALREKYNALWLAADSKGCIMREASPEVSGKTVTDEQPLVCKYCGPSDSEQWQILDGQLICIDCYKKFHASK